MVSQSLEQRLQYRAEHHAQLDGASLCKARPTGVLCLKNREQREPGQRWLIEGDVGQITYSCDAPLWNWCFIPTVIRSHWKV